MLPCGITAAGNLVPEMHVLFVVAIFAGLGFLLYCRTPLIFFAFAGVFFMMTWRMISTIYIDSSDVIYAEELFVNIGGGVSSLTLMFFYAVVSLGLLAAFSPARVATLRNLYAGGYCGNARYGNLDLTRIGGAIAVCFVALMYIELFAIGNIPFFTGMERNVYRLVHGGPMLKAFSSYQSFIFILMGFAFLSAYVAGNTRKMINILGICVAIFVYLVLIGNKFSGLFFNACFFGLPLSVLALGGGRQLRNRAGKIIAAAGGVVLVSLVIAALYNTFTPPGITTRTN